MTEFVGTPTLYFWEALQEYVFSHSSAQTIDVYINPNDLGYFWVAAPNDLVGYKVILPDSLHYFGRYITILGADWIDSGLAYAFSAEPKQITRFNWKKE